MADCKQTEPPEFWDKVEKKDCPHCGTTTISPRAALAEHAYWCNAVSGDGTASDCNCSVGKMVRNTRSDATSPTPTAEQAAPCICGRNTDTRIASALERIADGVAHHSQVLNAILEAVEDDDQAFWDRAFCAALTGVLAAPGPGLEGVPVEQTSDAVAGMAELLADAALAARQRKEST